MVRDITNLVCPKRILYLWDIHNQLIDDSGYELISDFEYYKKAISSHLEPYADILDYSCLPISEVQAISAEYKFVRELVQLNYLLSCNDPVVRHGYMDLHFSGRSSYLFSGRHDASQVLFDVKFHDGLPSISQLELVATFYTKSKNLSKLVSKRLGIDAFKSASNPLASYMDRLSNGFALHIYRSVSDRSRHSISDVSFICDFYEDIPELRVKHYIPSITTALEVFDCL